MKRRARWLADYYKGLEGVRKHTFWVAVVLAGILTCLIVARREAPKPRDGEAGKVKRSYDRGHRKNLPTHYFVQVYEWHAVRINIVICSALLLSCPWWMRWGASKQKPPKKISPPRERKLARRGLLMLLAALGVATALRVPRLDTEIWFDEQDNLRRSILGYYDHRGEGEPVWKGATWEDSFFENRLANNPVLYSVLAHASLDIWRAVSGGAADQFNIVALRMPSLLAGILAIVVLWGFLHWFGYPAAAIFAAFLFAIHPDAIFFSTQARGYTLMLVFAIIAIWAAIGALQTNRWRAWVVLGVAQFLCIYSYTGSVYFPMAINATLFCWLAVRWIKHRSEVDRSQIVKLTVVSAFSAMVILQMMLPVIVQADKFLHEHWYHTKLETDWIFDAWNHFCTGTDFPTAEDWWQKYPIDERPGIATYIFGEFIRDELSLFLIDFLLVPTLMIIGLLLVWKREPRAGLIAIAGIIAPALAFIHHRFFTGYWLHTWYVLYFLPIMFWLFSIGFTELPKLCRKFPAARLSSITAAGCALFLVWFGIITLVKDGKGRLGWSKSKSNQEIVFRRGHSLWKVTPDGRMHVVKEEDEPAP